MSWTVTWSPSGNILGLESLPLQENMAIFAGGTQASYYEFYRLNGGYSQRASFPLSLPLSLSSLRITFLPSLSSQPLIRYTFTP